MKRVRAVVSGRVQGVCFRAYTRERARDLKLAGYVRNLPDGSVEIVAEGMDNYVDALMEWASRGPSHARVSSIVISDMEPQGDLQEFIIEY